MLDIKKVIRSFIVGFLFLCLFHIIGVDLREVQQFAFLLGVITIFSFLVANLWITLFLCWTAFLFTYFRFNTGMVYLINVFLGSVLYYTVKVNFKKEHINFFINGVLGLIVLNVIYMFIQVLGFDFLYSGKEVLSANGEQLTRVFDNTRPLGFMGNLGYTGILVSLGMPFLLTRQIRFNYLYALCLFVPLFMAKSFLPLAGGLLGMLFVLFFKLSKKLWILIVCLVILMGGLYLKYVDRPGLERLSMWHMVLKDAKLHPVTGWGLDSYRNFTKEKQHIYLMNLRQTQRSENKVVSSDFWDNPHNLFISVFFEWGIVGLFLLGGYLRQLGIWFKNAVKEPNTLALAGAGLVILFVSMGHFPIFLARLAVVIIPIFALFEVQVK